MRPLDQIIFDGAVEKLLKSETPKSHLEKVARDYEEKIEKKRARLKNAHPLIKPLYVLADLFGDPLRAQRACYRAAKYALVQRQ